MNKFLTGALAALTIGGSLAATTVPASAQPHGGYHGGRGGDDGGYRGGYGGGYRGNDALGAGLVGLALGAALAGGNVGYGYGAPGYYAPGYHAAPRCRMEMRWNPRWGGYERVRVCY